MRQLIVTGDDFGLSVAVNEAIVAAHQDGILTTTSLMMSGEAAADAVARAQRTPSLKVGLHVVLVCGQPLLSPKSVPNLVDQNGNFSDRLVRAGVNFFFRPSVRQQLEAEIRAQFEAFRNTGLALDHVNAHNHMHLHPTVFKLILKIGRDFGVRAVRLPYEPFSSAWRGSSKHNILPRLAMALFLSPWLSVMRWRLRKAKLLCNDYIFGMSDTGQMTSTRVLEVLANLPQGVSEMYFHPGADAGPDASAQAPRGQEFVALTSPAVLAALRQSGIQEVTFSGLVARGH